jgi:hypothetical protein
MSVSLLRLRRMEMSEKGRLAVHYLRIAVFYGI